MYKILDLYQLEYHSDYPVICMDEKSKQLIENTREPIKLNHYGLQVHRFLKRMKFLFQNNIIRICIRRISMMFKILLYHLISNVAFKNMITIFCNPNYVRIKPRYSMSKTSLLFHNSKIQKWVATESLALKVHSFN